MKNPIFQQMIANCDQTTTEYTKNLIETPSLFYEILQNICDYHGILKEDDPESDIMNMVLDLAMLKLIDLQNEINSNNEDGLLIS